AAVRFLQRATDAYRSSGFRLVQSYQDNSGLTDIAFIYDNALTTIALLSAGDVACARAIGDGLLYAQTHDAEFDDFRLRQAYHANRFVDDAGVAISGYEFGLVGTAVGDMAWTGIALAQLARRTRNQSYLRGALRIGRWIYRNTYSASGLGGYTFGETAGLQDHKSSEHNIDVYAFFRMLAKLTGDQAWVNRADHAWAFVEKMWNGDGGFFWTGSDDGSTINKEPKQLPEDVQTWSWLAARKRRYTAALDWAANNLATTDTPLRANSALTGNYSVSGVVFASGSLITNTDEPIGGQSYNPKPDNASVWFEGTAHLALALRDRRADGHRQAAVDLLGEIRSAQAELGKRQTFGGKPAPGGIVAASSPLDTGFGFGYFPNLHIGATSWYVFAATNVNPYRFL
nr:Tat pathway signal sequence domain protein [Propionibacteriaceae bacterium]